MAARSVRKSNIAQGDISQTNVYQGVDPEEHAKLLSRISELEDSAKNAQSSEENESGGRAIVPLRETRLYSNSLGMITNAGVFSTILVFISFLFLIYSLELPFASPGEIEDCKNGLKSPEEIHPGFKEMSCEEIEDYVDDGDWVFTPAELMLIVSLLLFLISMLTLWRPAWNPAKIIDDWIGRMKTPYRNIGLILLAVSFAVLMLGGTEEEKSHWLLDLAYISCCFVPFIIGLNLMFISAKFDESGLVSLNLGNGEDSTG